jgi:hypothetical protein
MEEAGECMSLPTRAPDLDISIEDLRWIIEHVHKESGVVLPLEVAGKWYNGVRTIYKVVDKNYGYHNLFSFYTDPLDASLDSCCL